MNEQESQNLIIKSSRMPYKMLRLEGLVVMICALIATIYVKTHWLLIIGGFFFFDISLLGYKINPKIGAICYNIGHTFSIPVVLLLIAFILSIPILMSISFLWIGHIAYDKMLGFGLKYQSNFNDTYLQQI